jgi:hypothetical protein
MGAAFTRSDEFFAKSSRITTNSKPPSTGTTDRKPFAANLSLESFIRFLLLLILDFVENSEAFDKKPDTQ